MKTLTQYVALSIAMYVLCVGHAYAKAIGPSEYAILDDQLLEEWPRFGGFPGTDVNSYIRAVFYNGSCFAVVMRWDDEADEYIVGQFLETDSDGHFYPPSSGDNWQFTLTGDCTLMWEKVEPPPFLGS